MIYGLRNANLFVYRNCIVGKNFTVKISDHAMYCGRYEADYYVSDTKARLPIRWMAWESLLLVSIFHQFKYCNVLHCSYTPFLLA
jgi:hypothetical protein